MSAAPIPQLLSNEDCTPITMEEKPVKSTSPYHKNGITMDTPESFPIFDSPTTNGVLDGPAKDPKVHNLLWLYFACK